MADSADHSGPLDAEMYQVFFAKSHLHKLKSTKATLVLGRMGSGKSTAISIQQGAQYEMGDDDHLHLSKTGGGFIPKVSSGYESKTLNVGIFEDPETGQKYLDTAGLNENRGHNYKTWTTFSASLALSLVDQLESVIIVANYGSLMERGAGFMDLAEEIESVAACGDASKIFFKSMIFLVNGAYVGPRPVKPEKIVKDCDGLMAFLTEKLDNTKKALEKQLDSASGGSDALKQVSAEDSIDLKKTEAGMRLVEAFKKAATLNRSNENERVYRSYPDDETAWCEVQRRKICEYILSTPSLKSEELSKVVEARGNHSLDVLQMCANLCTMCISEGLQPFIQNVEPAVKAYRENSKMMGDCDSDWKSVLRNLQTNAAQDLDRIDKELKNVEQRRNAAATSDKLFVWKDMPVREARSAFPNPVWLGKNLFRGVTTCTMSARGFATHYFSLMNRDEMKAMPAADRWYSKHDITNRGFLSQAEVLGEEKKGSAEGPADPELEIRLVSHGGYDISCNIQLLREEKFLDSTKKRIAAFDKEIADLREKRSKFIEKKNDLAGLQDRKQVKDYMLGNLTKQRTQMVAVHEKLNEVTGWLDKEKKDEEGVKLSEVMTGMYRFLHIAEDAVCEDLKKGGIYAQIQDFLKLYPEAIKWQKEIDGWSSFHDWLGFSDFGFGAEAEGFGEGFEQTEKVPETLEAEGVNGMGDSPLEKLQAEVDKEKQRVQELQEELEDEQQLVANFEAQIKTKKRMLARKGNSGGYSK